MNYKEFRVKMELTEQEQKNLKTLAEVAGITYGEFKETLVCDWLRSFSSEVAGTVRDSQTKIEAQKNRQKLLAFAKKHGISLSTVVAEIENQNE